MPGRPVNEGGRVSGQRAPPDSAGTIQRRGQECAPPPDLTGTIQRGGYGRAPRDRGDVADVADAADAADAARQPRRTSTTPATTSSAPAMRAALTGWRSSPNAPTWSSQMAIAICPAMPTVISDASPIRGAA